MKQLFIFACTCLLSLNAISGSHVNILVYHHVSESTPASTSISPENFRQHMQLLKDEGFTVVNLVEAVEKLKNNEPVPHNAVAITFDDGFRNIHDNAWPILKEFNYPFVMFIATDSIDAGYRNMMTWDQLRAMHNQGVTVVNHTADHDYLVRERRRDAQWLSATFENINKAQTRLEQELGEPLIQWLAYPYGEYSLPLADALLDAGYVGFAQHSGGFWSGSNFGAIPRFAAAGIYANPKTLITKLRSRPMPIDESQTADMVTTSNIPVFEASLVTKADFASGLNCFVNGDWTEAQWTSELTFTLKTAETLGEGRHRYNCTAKAKSGDFYYWYSKPWVVYGAE